MSNERLGIVEEGRRRREIFAGFPGGNIRPGATQEEAVCPVLTLAKHPPSSEIAALVRRVGSLTAKLTARERELDELRAQIFPSHKRIPIALVMAKFCETARAEGYLIGAREYMPGDLLTERRSRPTAWARHVCIELTHRLCGVSTSLIGRAFGIDHTTVLHACRNVPRITAEWPILARVHARTLAAFEAQQ